MDAIILGDGLPTWIGKARDRYGEVKALEHQGSLYPTVAHYGVIAEDSKGGGVDGFHLVVLL